MPHSESYGEMLRNARKKRRIDLASAARRLRIRPDILQAIEEADFSRMPPRGYTRNMIAGYARLVGLDPNEITSYYIEEANRYEAGIPATSSRRGSYSDMSRQSSRDSYNTTSQRSATSRQGRTTRSTKPFEQDRAYAGSRRGSSSNRAVGGGAMPTQRRSQTRAASSYPRFYSAAQQGTRTGSIPTSFIIIAAIIIILIIIIVLVIIFGGNRQTAADEDVPNVPISGFTDTSGDEEGESAEEQEDVAPTSATVTYEVASGNRSWIEVNIDDEEEPEVQEVVEGPATQTYSVTGTLEFTTANPDPVTLTVDGQPVELELNEDGDYTYTVNFADVLNQWLIDHNQTATNTLSTGATDEDTENSTASTASSGLTDEEDEDYDYDEDEDYDYDYDYDYDEDEDED